MPLLSFLVAMALQVHQERLAFISTHQKSYSLEEMLEMITWSQLNIHSKPILVLNTRRFFTPLVEWVNVAVRGTSLES